jgi:hypothetical protein
MLVDGYDENNIYSSSCDNQKKTGGQCPSLKSGYDYWITVKQSICAAPDPHLYSSFYIFERKHSHFISINTTMPHKVLTQSWSGPPQQL